MNKNFTLYKLPNYFIKKDENTNLPINVESKNGPIQEIVKLLSKNNMYHLQMRPNNDCIIYLDIDHVYNEDILL